MPIPPYQKFFSPILRILSDGNEWKNRDLQEEAAKVLGITDEEKRQMLPSGAQQVYVNRALWAKTYLKKAGLVDSPARGALRITDNGLAVLAKQGDAIDTKFLLGQSEAFRAFHSGTSEKQEVPELVDASTPQETMEKAYRILVGQVTEELLNLVMSRDDKFFEQLVVDLLVAMGYGGSIDDAGQTLGRTGDAGIDGVIKEDRLGLDLIYMQAKRWTSTTVGRPEIQKFAGALAGQRAKKGIFITTSTFSGEARDYVKNIDSKIVLIDGAELAQLMYDFNVGVSTQRKIEIKKVDSDFFES